MSLDSKKVDFVLKVSCNFTAFVNDHIPGISHQRTCLEKLFSIIARDRGGIVFYNTLDGVTLSYRLFKTRRADKTIRSFLRPSSSRSNYFYTMVDSSKSDFAKMRRGYLANFIQSLDRAVLRLVIIGCAMRGVYFRHTHDCFSLNPADVFILRDVIEDVYQEHVFKTVTNSEDVRLWGSSYSKCSVYNLVIKPNYRFLSPRAQEEVKCIFSNLRGSSLNKKEFAKFVKDFKAVDSYFFEGS